MTPQIQKIREVCEGLIKARNKAMMGEWHAEDTGFKIDPQWWIRLFSPDFGDLSIASVRRGCEEAGPHSQNEFDAKFIALAANTSAKIARSLLIAIDALEIHRGSLYRSTPTEDDPAKMTCVAEDALEQIASQMTGEL